jgi:hypothetical protein
VAKKPRKDDDDGDVPGTQCWHCQGKCVIPVKCDGNGPEANGGTGADFERCPTCNGKGYL